ncbi:hypothetical protein ACR789_13870 [Sphingobacterium siyangense]|uniref:hypothetical protein n=1 Tax=Sphingobacterium siyangense TaxID=459529 RepID=UPI003DA1DC74
MGGHFLRDVNTIDFIKYLYSELKQAEQPQIKESYNGLSAKQNALLFQCLFEVGFFSKEFNSIDNTKQSRLIAGIVGIKIDSTPNNWNFYKFWNSIRSTKDEKKVLTADNIQAVLDLANYIGFSPLINNLQEKQNKIR